MTTTTPKTEPAEIDFEQMETLFWRIEDLKDKATDNTRWKALHEISQLITWAWDSAEFAGEADPFARQLYAQALDKAERIGVRA